MGIETPTGRISKSQRSITKRYNILSDDEQMELLEKKRIEIMEELRNGN